jgi:hypothetical protein
MGEEQRLSPTQPGKPVPGAFGPMDEPLEFAARPANDIEIDPLESGTQLCPVEGAVVADPASNDQPDPCSTTYAISLPTIRRPVAPGRLASSSTAATWTPCPRPWMCTRRVTLVVHDWGSSHRLGWQLPAPGLLYRLSPFGAKRARNPLFRVNPILTHNR